MSLLRSLARLCVLATLCAGVMLVAAASAALMFYMLALSFGGRTDERMTLEAALEALSRGVTVVDPFAMAMTLVFHGSLWFAWREISRARTLAREVAQYEAAEEAENAQLARALVRETGVRIFLLALPAACIGAYALGSYPASAHANNLWLASAIACSAPMAFAYFADRLAATWDSLRTSPRDPQSIAPLSGDSRLYQGDAAHAEGGGEAATLVAADMERTPAEVVIELSADELHVAADDVGELRWAIRAASAAELLAPARGERRSIPLTGAMRFHAPLEQEVFSIVATGPDGARHARSFRVTPVPPGLDCAVPGLEHVLGTAPEGSYGSSHNFALYAPGTARAAQSSP
jgi:hypothetical protein